MVEFKLLEVNLSNNETKTVDVSDDIRRYLGGRGFGAKLQWDRIPPKAGALGEDNILYIGVGPITGLIGAVTSINAKSPLTLRGGTSHINGHFGSELIYAGYNAGILISGKAPKPVYIYVNNDSVEIHDASHLWGKHTVIASQQALHKELYKNLKDQNTRIMTIGPAGEHLVRNAGIFHDFLHVAARLGMGAVMGSKNLKAIAVKGTKDPGYHDPHRVYELMRTFQHESRLKKAQDRRFGHSMSIPDRYYSTTEGIKNKQLGWNPICDLSNPVIHEQQFKVWNDSCNICHIACYCPAFNSTPTLGPSAGELRHDNCGGWNANVMLPGYDAQLYLSPYVDELGLDGEDVSGVVAWMMECYQRNLVSKDALDGIDLTWGNLPAICRLLKKIAFREGVGDVLAEGLKLAAPKFAKEMKPYAMTGKGIAITSYEPRGSLKDAIDLAMVPVGELHASRGDPRRVVCDSLTICAFLRREIAAIFGFDTFARDMLKATCGWDVSQQEWLDIIQRGAYMERCYCMREGYRPIRDDILPDRFFDETIYNKYGEPKVLNRNEFMEAKEKLYLSFGLNKQGIPPKEELKRLGMGFVIDELKEIVTEWE